MEENKNEIMEMSEVTAEPEVIEEQSQMPTGVAMLIGGALTVGAIAGFKRLKKVWDDHKAKKAVSEPEGEVVDITDHVKETDETEE